MPRVATVRDAVREIRTFIFSGEAVEDAMEELLDWCEETSPSPAWARLRSYDFTSELDPFREWWQGIFEHDGPPDDSDGLLLVLDEEGELAFAATDALAEDGLSAIQDPTWLSARTFNSATLRAIRTALKGGGDVAEGLGTVACFLTWLSLAAREAAKEIDLGLLLGDADEVRVTASIGARAGLLLGVIDRDGSHLCEEEDEKE
jgi:hypothetical protein